MALGIEGDRVSARHVLKQGEQIYCSLSWAEELAGPRGLDDANDAARGDRALLAGAGWAARASPIIAGATRSSARRWRSRD